MEWTSKFIIRWGWSALSGPQDTMQLLAQELATPRTDRNAPAKATGAGPKSEESLPKQLLITTGQTHKRLAIPVHKPERTAPPAPGR